MISSAISRFVQCVIGRPTSSGFSQASSSIRQICSALIRAGAPGRGRSSKRSSTLRSSRVIGCKANQRCRHNLGMSLLIPYCLAICELFSPSAAANTTRARKAICCRALCRFVNFSSSSRSLSVKLIGVGFLPRICFLLSRSAVSYSTPISLSIYCIPI